MRKVKAFDSYVVKPTINAKISGKVFKATGGSVKLSKNNKSITFIYILIIIALHLHKRPLKLELLLCLLFLVLLSDLLLSIALSFLLSLSLSSYYLGMNSLLY